MKRKTTQQIRIKALIKIQLLSMNISSLSYRGHSITTWTRRSRQVVNRKSILSYVNKRKVHSKYAKCPQLSNGGGRRLKLGRIWFTYYLNAPYKDMKRSGSSDYIYVVNLSRYIIRLFVSESNFRTKYLVFRYSITLQK